MELDDRLLRDIRKNERNSAQQDAYYADEPDWMIYEERKREEPLNQYRGAFDVADERSINKAPSVFDKGTVFRTGDTGKK